MSNRFIVLSILCLSPALAFAQAAGSSSFWERTFGIMTLVAAALVILTAALSVVRLYKAVDRAEELRQLTEQGVDISQLEEESWWNRFLKAATNAVPVEREQEIDQGLDYDGIRELDNKLPPWWLWMFYVSIVFGVVYFAVLHVFGAAPTLAEEYERDMESARAAIEAYKATQADNVDENSVVALTDVADIELGKEVFDTYCFPCHGSMGEGNTIGPNLTDEYWIHGGGIKNIFHTINYGVIEKGMQSWKETLRPVEIQQVSSYILSLQGTNPPNAKEPQGELWKPEKGADTPAMDEGADEE